jgi:hypothetical protein
VLVDRVKLSRAIDRNNTQTGTPDLMRGIVALAFFPAPLGGAEGEAIVAPS